MRNKIDYGIDLGTTNSAIVRMESGVPVVKKSDTLKDTVPSCIYFNKKGDCIVGDSAYAANHIEHVRALKKFLKGGTNSFTEFKRTMGSSHRYQCLNKGREFSSEELSSEVLKKLKSLILDENTSSVVITVPAKFTNPQNEATMTAAKLAGFTQVQLLQEPVAAATAYGLGAKSEDGYWCVFDFGGGTFDVALVKSEDGILTLKDTDGDSWLGGKNIDEAIVDQVIIPYLITNNEIDFVLNDPSKREMLRNALKGKAEETKVQLSFKDTHRILTDLGDLPFVDENGEEPEIDIQVTQEDMERVVTPFFQKALDVTKKLLSRNNLSGSDLGAFILVGGPTHSPILRNMIREQITENLDLSVDPMTVVAQGAALYASTISIDANIIELERDKLKVQLDLKYEATTVEKEEMVSIRILPDKMDGVLPEIFMVDLHRLPEGFKTGQKQINDKPCLIDVLLESNCPNEFEILAFDGMGNRLECEPNRFTILQGVGGVSSMQVLPYHIGIVKYYSAQEKELFSPVKGLEKSKPIKSGLTGVADGLKTQKDIRPGSAEDMIRIPIYQGDYHSEGTNPDLNFHVSDAVLSGESFPKVLSSGSPVNLRIKVDASGLMTVIAEFPTIEHEEMVKIEIQQSNPPTQDELRGKVKLSLGVAKELADQTISDRLLRLSGEIDDIGTSADGRLRLMDEYRKILLELDDLEKKTEWPKLEQAMKESFYELEELVERIVVNGDDEKLNMDKVEAYIIDLRQKIEHAISEQDTRLAKELTKEVGQLDFDLRNAVTGNAMDAQLLRHIDESFGDYHWKNATKARQLVNQGLQMAANGQTSAIRPLIIELIALLPDDEKSDLLVG